ncbi:hypothetical protein C4572_03650 [Candidatus Parcubacteria bacterium]|nr:MAG: hypothetical protein C4572_03650 [Candidatus Parcubacteria bacterium]
MKSLEKIYKGAAYFLPVSAIIFFSVTTLFFGGAADSLASNHLGDFIPCEGNDCGICDIFQLISNIVNFAAFKLASPLAVLILIYGGFMYITSGGNEKNKAKGTNAFWAAIWGIVIVFGAWMIVNVILGGLAGESISESWNKFPGCDD